MRYSQGWYSPKNVMGGGGDGGRGGGGSESLRITFLEGVYGLGV